MLKSIIDNLWSYYSLSGNDGNDGGGGDQHIRLPKYIQSYIIQIIWSEWTKIYGLKELLPMASVSKYWFELCKKQLPLYFTIKHNPLKQNSIEFIQHLESPYCIIKRVNSVSYHAPKSIHWFKQSPEASYLEMSSQDREKLHKVILDHVTTISIKGAPIVKDIDSIVKKRIRNVNHHQSNESIEERNMIKKVSLNISVKAKCEEYVAKLNPIAYGVEELYILRYFNKIELLKPFTNLKKLSIHLTEKGWGFLEMIPTSITYLELISNLYGYSLDPLKRLTRLETLVLPATSYLSHVESIYDLLMGSETITSVSTITPIYFNPALFSNVNITDWKLNIMCLGIDFSRISALDLRTPPKFHNQISRLFLDINTLGMDVFHGEYIKCLVHQPVLKHLTIQGDFRMAKQELIDSFIDSTIYFLENRIINNNDNNNSNSNNSNYNNNISIILDTNLDISNLKPEFISRVLEYRNSWTQFTIYFSTSNFGNFYLSRVMNSINQNQEVIMKYDPNPNEKGNFKNKSLSFLSNQWY